MIYYVRYCDLSREQLDEMIYFMTDVYITPVSHEQLGVSDFSSNYDMFDVFGFDKQQDATLILLRFGGTLTDMD